MYNLRYYILESWHLGRYEAINLMEYAGADQIGTMSQHTTMAWLFISPVI